MAAPTTPTPASSSKLVQVQYDSAVRTVTTIGFVTSTANVAGLNATGAAMFGTPIIMTTSYTMTSLTSSAFPILSASTSTQITITRVVSSAPVVVTNYTMYNQVVASNTTVFSSGNTVYSLLQQLAQAGNDTVAIKNWATVTDTES